MTKIIAGLLYRIWNKQLRVRSTPTTGTNPCPYNDKEKSAAVSYTKKMDALTLGELAGLIKSTIQSSLNDEYWVTAEIAQINYNFNSGHCYLDLAEKQNDATTAKMRAAIWASNFRQINNNFRAMTGQELQAGMKILMFARVNFHEVHGLSLNIRDIDPRYTLGEMALKRRQIIDRLTKEGIIDKNRQLDLPPVLQKIAVVSSMSAAGYGDFQSRLNNNPYGYRFYHRLFQAHMQGEKAEESIGNALKKCIASREHFEVIVIIRGGGSIIDLHCFDSYPLAKLIALSPLPVFTGIGHERDETVIDRVANQRLITPTAVAEFLIYASKKFEDSVDNFRQRLIVRTNTLLEREEHSVNNFAENLKRHVKHYCKTAANTLKNNSYLLQKNTLAALKTPFVDLLSYEGRLRNSGSLLLKNSGQKLKDYKKVLEVRPWHMLSIQSQRIENYNTKIGLLDPHHVLSRGYSITFLNGKILKGTGQTRKGDIISTSLHEGAITSIVESTGEKEKNE